MWGEEVRGEEVRGKLVRGEEVRGEEVKCDSKEGRLDGRNGCVCVCVGRIGCTGKKRRYERWIG